MKNNNKQNKTKQISCALVCREKIQSFLLHLKHFHHIVRKSIEDIEKVLIPLFLGFSVFFIINILKKINSFSVFVKKIPVFLLDLYGFLFKEAIH